MEESQCGVGANVLDMAIQVPISLLQPKIKD